jgi:hypothetical protein
MVDFLIITSRHITFGAENLASPVLPVKIFTLAPYELKPTNIGVNRKTTLDSFYNGKQYFRGFIF